jgi:triacylglycerol lipase
VLRRALILLVACLASAAAAPAAHAVSSLEDPPAGANDFSCKPSAAHPKPVVLLHGLGARMSENWGYVSPRLAERGYCVFALTYGMDPRLPNRGGTIPAQESAPEIAEFVDRVLAETGAQKVDLVGHSEGTFTPQYWLKFLGGAPKVDKYVAFTPLYDGTTLLGVDQIRDIGAQFGLSDPLIDLVAEFCGFCPQALAGSDLVKEMNAAGKGAPGVTYTTVMTKYDQLVIPYASGVMDAPGTTNHVLQDICPANFSEHALVAFDPVALQLTLNALDPTNARPVDCAGTLPPPTGPAAATAGGDAATADGAGAPVSATVQGAPRRSVGARLRSRFRAGRVGDLTLLGLPKGTSVRVTCAPARRGARSGCPFASRTRTLKGRASAMRLHRLFTRRTLTRGTRVGVIVTRKGSVGRAYAFTVRRDGGAAKVRRPLVAR